MNKPKLAEVNCPECGSLNPASESICAACRKSLVVYIGPPRALPRSYGIGSLMCLVAAIALGLGLIRVEPIIGVPMLFVVVPAMIRTMAVASQKREDRVPFGPESQLVVLIASMGMMAAVLMCGAIVFVMTFFLLGQSLRSSPLGIAGVLVICGLFALASAALVLIRFWRYPY